MGYLEKNSCWWVNENELHASFMDWIAFIRPIHVGDGNVLMWELKFSHGSGTNEESSPIYCKTMEEAVNLVDHYSNIIHFDDLIKQLFEDQNRED